MIKAVKEKIKENLDKDKTQSFLFPTFPETYIVSGSVEGNSTFLSDSGDEDIASRFLSK